MKRKNRQSGFTIIELMFSTVVFSLVLMLALAGIMQITRLYYRGITQSNTQETARAIIDEISQSIQFSNNNILRPVDDNGDLLAPLPRQIAANTDNTTTDDIRFLCIGDKRYTYAIDRQLIFDNPSVELKQRPVVLWVDQPASGCADAANITGADISTQAAAGDGVELLKENMRITQLEVSEVDIADSENSNIWKIDVAIAYGDNDLLEAELDADGNIVRIRCVPSTPGVEFCATSEISTTVRRRVE